jgi:formylglycine-generating enzyme required for sulfatase activity
MYQAENMYTTDQVKSGLVTGTQWDTTMKWIKNSGKNVTDDSTAWGNYSNSPVSGHGVKQVTGYSDSWKAKNIYDLAGNTLEWTNEAFISNRITRGGFYTWSGSDYPAACRNVNPADNVLNNLSFRVVLYVM